MKILLVVPMSNTDYIVPPLGLGYLATALRKEKFEIQILDCIKRKISFEKFKVIIKEGDFNVVGIQTFSCDLFIVQRLIDIVKGVNPSILTIVGGAHPSGVGTKIFDDLRNLDFGFKGEAEIGLPLLLKKIGDSKLENIPGLIWKSGSHRICNSSLFVEDLDSFGFPSWDLINPQTYQHAPQGVFLRTPPVTPISTSRGCPFECTYCAGKTITGAKIRKHSMEYIMEEIELLYHHYGIRELHIVDDTFTQFRDRVVSFCNLLLEKNLKISFTFPNGVRLDTLDGELLSLMKKAGCYSMIVGIESGSQRILDHMKKRLKLEKIEEKISLIHKAGIEVRGFFILGYPTETKNDILATIKFAKKLKLTAVHFSNFLPLPGTEIAEELLKDGKIEKIDWSKLFYSKVPFSPSGISINELKKFQRKAYLTFYLRPIVLIRLFSQIKSFHHFWSIIKRFKNYLFSN